MHTEAGLWINVQGAGLTWGLGLLGLCVDQEMIGQGVLRHCLGDQWSADKEPPSSIPARPIHGLICASMCGKTGTWN